MQKEIRLPFDGMAKDPSEVAKMIGAILKKGCKEKVDIILPTQWAWGIMNLLHPKVGLMTVLNKDSDIRENYKFTCHSVAGEIGVTATPC